MYYNAVMNNQLSRMVQSIILIGGVVFASYNIGHEVASKINPFTSTCIYGGAVFVGALIWAISIATPKSRYRHNWLLAVGALFSWFNWAMLNWAYYHQTACLFNCEAGSPWTAPCLYGALLFTLALSVGLRLNSTKQ